MQSTEHTAEAAPVFTRNFVLACVASLGAFLSFYLLMASLPVYIGLCGGSESAVGFVLGIFSVSAVLVRPFAGQQSDRTGKKALMVGGSLVLVLASLAYGWAGGVGALSALRFLHGLGWGAFSTTCSALVADIVPAARRGEAVGYFGMFGNAAMAVGPALGAAVSGSLGFPTLFVGCAVAAALALVSSSLLRLSPNPSAGPQRRPALINRRVLYPSVVLAISTLTYASVVSFLPLFAAKRGLGNPGLFFTVYAIALVLSRGPLGRLSDRYGRRATVAPGLILGAIALAILSTAESQSVLFLAALLYGLFFAAVQPALMAMAIDRVGPAERGSAMGTFTMAMDVGIGAGSFLWGFVVPATGFGTMYLAAAGVTLLALVVLLAGGRERRTARA